MDYQAVIPEFVVSDLEKSRHFYCDLLGFSVEYERPEEKFLFLSLEDCQLMLEEGGAGENAAGKDEESGARRCGRDHITNQKRSVQHGNEREEELHQRNDGSLYGQDP